MSLDRYESRYPHARLSRADGVLEVVLHTDGATLIWNQDVHDELPYLFADIAEDPANRVMLLTGAGEAFCDNFQASSFKVGSAIDWDVIRFEGSRLLNNLLAINVPIIAAVNGPARYHAEVAVMSDIVIASQTSVFQDAPHFPHGGVPGDGVHVVWTHVLGPNRGRYFLLTGQELSADEALSLGVVSEVLPPADVLPRARQLARAMAEKPPLSLRYTRELLTLEYRRIMTHGVSIGLALQGLATQAKSPLSFS